MMKSCRVRAETDCKWEVEKIRAQGVEQSGLLRNARAGRTDLPLSAAEKAKLLFLEPSFVTTCSASAAPRCKSLSFEKTLWRNCSGERRNGALYTLFSRLLLSFFLGGCLVKIINSWFFLGLQPEIISSLINLSEQWINHLASKVPWNREARHDFLKPKLTYSNDLNCSCIDWLISCQLYINESIN